MHSTYKELVRIIKTALMNHNSYCLSIIELETMACRTYAHVYVYAYVGHIGNCLDLIMTITENRYSIKCVSIIHVLLNMMPRQVKLQDRIQDPAS